MSTVLAHHNTPIVVSDHLSPLFKDIFPDSEIAKAYSCAQTNILNGAPDVDFQASLVEYNIMKVVSIVQVLMLAEETRSSHVFFRRPIYFFCWMLLPHGT